MTGAAFAYALKQRAPQLRCVLVEAKNLASGATGRNAGFLTCGSVAYFKELCARHGRQTAREVWSFRQENLQRLRNLLAADGAPQTAWHGSVSTTRCSVEYSSLLSGAALMEEAGFPTQELSSQEMLQRGLTNFARGLLCTEEGGIESAELVQHLVRLSRCEVQTQVGLTQVTRQDDLWSISWKGSEVHAQTLFVALNAFTPRDILSDITPLRAQCLRTAPLPQKIIGNTYISDRKIYFRQRPDGRLVIGGLRGLDRDGETGLTDRIHPEIQAALQAFVRDELQIDITTEERWSGPLAAVTSPWPLISVDRARSRLALAGYGGHGMGVAFLAADRLVGWWLANGSLPPTSPRDLFVDFPQ